VAHIGIGPISAGPVTAESEERCGRRCLYRMKTLGNLDTGRNSVFIVGEIHSEIKLGDSVGLD
jgi:hypothetical protein